MRREKEREREKICMFVRILACKKLVCPFSCNTTIIQGANPFFGTDSNLLDTRGEIFFDFFFPGVCWLLLCYQFDQNFINEFNIVEIKTLVNRMSGICYMNNAVEN